MAFHVVTVTTFCTTNVLHGDILSFAVIGYIPCF